MQIQDIAAVAILFVVAGITVGISAEILQNIETEVNTTGQASVDAPASIVANATLGISKIAKWMPTIGLVCAAAIVIGVVMYSFAGGQV